MHKQIKYILQAVCPSKVLGHAQTAQQDDHEAQLSPGDLPHPELLCGRLQRGHHQQHLQFCGECDYREPERQSKTKASV